MSIDDNQNDSPADAAPGTHEDFPGDRIAKILSRAGIASRRDAERMITEGRVKVNGKAITSPALNVGPKDRISVDGTEIGAPEPIRMWLYHKPAGIVTTAKDEEGRPTVFDQLPEGMPYVMTIGRLDITSEGLLLLTNDGEIKRRLELPSTGWLRRYRVRVNGEVGDSLLDALRAGVTVDGVEYQGMEAQLDRQQGANAWLTVGLREGKNREIRRVMDHLGVQVNRLIRLSYGPFQLGELEPGAVQELRSKVVRDQLGLGTKAEPLPLDTAKLKPAGRAALSLGARAAAGRPVVSRKPRPLQDEAQGTAEVRHGSGASKPRTEGAPERPRKIKPSSGKGFFRPERPQPEAEVVEERPDRHNRPDRGDRPQRGERSDRRPSDRPEGGFRKGPRPDGDRKPYAARGDGERKPYAPRGDGERKPYAPRDGGDGARKEFGPRKTFGKPAFGDRDRAPREGGARPEGGFRKGPRPDGDRKGFAPRAGFGKPEGDRAPRDGAEQGFRKGPRDGGDRPEGGFRKGPRADGDRKPYAPRGDGERKPYAPRGDGDGPRKDFAPRKSFGAPRDGAKGPRPTGGPADARGGAPKSFGPRSGGPKGGGPRGPGPKGAPRGPGGASRGGPPRKGPPKGPRGG